MPEAERELIERIYDAAISPAGWSAVLCNLADRVGATQALLFTPDVRAGAGGLWHSHRIDPAHLASYGAYYHSRDIWSSRAAARGLDRSGAVLRGEQIVDSGEFARSEFYNDFLRPSGVGRLCSDILHDGRRGTARTHLSFYRPMEAESFSDGSIALLKRLTPHLRRSVRLTFAVSRQQSVPPWSAVFMDQLSWGVFLLAGDRRVLQCNRAGAAMAAEGDGLAIADRRLRAARPEETERLDALIASGTGGDLLFRRPSGLRPYAVSVAALGPGTAEANDLVGTRTAVHVSDLAADPGAPAERFGDLFGLSRAERRLASELLAGHRLRDIGERYGISTATLRTQLRSIFDKTETGRQSELLRLILRATVTPSR